MTLTKKRFRQHLTLRIDPALVLSPEMVFGSGGGGTNERRWGREGRGGEGRSKEEEGAQSFTHDTRIHSFPSCFTIPAQMGKNHVDTVQLNG